MRRSGADWRKTGGKALPSLLFFAVVSLPWSGDIEAATDTASDTSAFLEQHWAYPIEAQGRVPEHGMASLVPEDCGRCHAAQLRDWAGSRHRAAMGPGVMGQLIDFAPAARAACLRCHAPLAEQATDLALQLEGARSDSALHEQGLVCAACHLRGYVWHGPPRRDGSVPLPDTSLPHAGWQANTAFEEAEFCSACHQFADDGFALNGKLLENTYLEWAESAYAERGVTCQICHMPQRRHLWRGIHDRDMTRAGVTIHASATRLEHNVVSASLTIENSGTGHHFPSYVTPAVIAEGYQETADGTAIPGTQTEQVIARKVPVSLREEIFDTRIAAGEHTALQYQRDKHPQAARLGFRVRVEPDAFYSDFFQAVLRGDVTSSARPLLEHALDESKASGYELFKVSLTLADVPVPEVVFVPGGEFIMGSDQAERELAYRLDEAAYRHGVTREQGWYDKEITRQTFATESYAITVTPITNRQYAAFVEATGHPAPDVAPDEWQSYGLIHPYARTRRHAWANGEPPAGRADHPVVLVSHDDATAYAEWLSTVTGRRWRLPSEAQWEKAARGTDGRSFPWGADFLPARLNSHDAGPFDTAAVGSYPGGASPFGLLDAAGQVFEWTATANGAKRMIVKGGSWDDKGCGVCRPAARHSRPVHLQHILIGFRLVQE